MRDVFLGRRRGEWVAYLRAVHQRDVSRRQGGSSYDDGMCHGIIPFGAVKQWKSEADRRLSETLARPLVGRVMGWDASGLGLAVVCPWCGAEHRYIVTEDWEAGSVLEASCGKGLYRVSW